MTTHNKVAIVTGAGTGIGKAVTLALLRDGYRVALAGRRREPLEQTAGQSGERGAGAGRADGRKRRGLGAGALRTCEGELRPAGSPLQQRRHFHSRHGDR